MGLPRVFVCFSSNDIKYYRLMQAWKENENIDFDFANCQLQDDIYSENEEYIKRKCRERINLAGKYILLIGDDTAYKHKYVLWEAQVAIEKECIIIGVNLDCSREITLKCPSVIKNIGAIFVPFSPKIVQYAIENYKMHKDDDYHYKKEVYDNLGY